MKHLDCRLYLVLDPTLCKNRNGLLQTTEIAVKNGVTMVQLRAKDEYNALDWYETGLALKALLANTSVPLIVNDRLDIALAINADGLHVGQNDLPVPVIRQFLGKDKILGLSTSNEHDIKNVPWDFVDYIGIGPVYPTQSKKNAPPAIGCETLASLYALAQKPAVAIGGINADRVADVLKTHVDGIAVVSAICGQKDIAFACQTLDNAISKRSL